MRIVEQGIQVNTASIPIEFIANVASTGWASWSVSDCGVTAEIESWKIVLIVVDSWVSSCVCDAPLFTDSLEHTYQKSSR